MRIKLRQNGYLELEIKIYTDRTCMTNFHIKPVTKPRSDIFLVGLLVTLFIGDKPFYIFDLQTIIYK